MPTTDPNDTCDVIGIAVAVVTCCIVMSSSAVSALAPSPNDSCRKPTPQLLKPLNDRREFVYASACAALPSFASIAPARAISPEEASESYDAYAATYDDLDGGSVAASLGIDEARRKLLRAAKGDVLEIGVGTGLNLDSYVFESINSLTLVDVSEGMLSQARQRVLRRAGGGGATPPVRFERLDATRQLRSLFGENRFDTVVDTFSLCVMGNEGAQRCLAEMAGVVKKREDGGQILLLENTRASNPLLGYYQDITASTAADVGGKGCIYNQNVGEMIRHTEGLHLAKEEAFAAGLFRSFTCQKS